MRYFLSPTSSKDLEAWQDHVNFVHCVFTLNEGRIKQHGVPEGHEYAFVKSSLCGWAGVPRPQKVRTT